jgi:phosphatidylinositol alpha-mannosyltransferase
MAETYYEVEVQVLFNGVDVARFAKAEPWPTELPCVLFVGRHEPRKGLGVLLEAWREIDRDALVWVAGEGPETEALRARAVPAVKWLGRIGDDELARRMRAATVFCAPALSHESFGIVLLEAMAAATPVVASDIPGYRNVARAGREGLLVPPGDPGALRAALRRALDEPQLRANLVETGDARAEEYSLRRLAERYVTVYEEALRRPPVG